MEKKRKMAIALAAVAVLLLMAGVSQLAYAASAAAAGPSCSSMPELSLDKQQLSMAPGRIATIKMTVTGTQPESCGTQTYGVDFTNAYGVTEFFSLGVRGATNRHLFNLAPGQSKTFEGLVGAMPETPAGDYTIQVTAYPEADHWKQASKTVKAAVGAQAGSDAHWETQLDIGWNAIPYAGGIGAYGCPGVYAGYRYSPSTGEYVVMDRYGPIFAPAPYEKDLENERTGAIFVFATKRCTIESRVPPEAFEGNALSIGEGQFLSIPPQWHGQKVGNLQEECTSGIEASYWDSYNQKWMEAQASMPLENGKAIKVKSSSGCQLDPSIRLAGQVAE